jgi:hypothetical protein
MALITTGSHPKALWPGVATWFGISYDEFPEEYKDIFDVFTSDKNYEEDVQSYGFGLASIKDQGDSVSYTDVTQGPTKRYTHVVYGLGYIVTREEIEDNLYAELARKRAAALAFSMRTTKELVHANVWNRCTTSGYTGADGVVLLSDSHVTKGATQSNILSPAADLSETSLEDLNIMIMTAKDDLGIQVPLMAKSLHIAPNEWFEANRILKSVLQSLTSNNAINVLKSTNAIPGGIKVNHYFTDTDAYFLKTNIPADEGFKSYQRRAREFTKDNDFDTENAKAKATERYTASWTNWRVCYGTIGA